MSTAIVKFCQCLGDNCKYTVILDNGPTTATVSHVNCSDKNLLIRAIRDVLGDHTLDVTFQIQKICCERDRHHHFGIFA